MQTSKHTRNLSNDWKRNSLKTLLSASTSDSPESKSNLADLPSLNPALPPSSPGEENLMQKTIHLPTQRQSPQDAAKIKPPGPTTGGSAISVEGEEPGGLQPLTKKEEKLAEDLAGLYYTLSLAVTPWSQFAATVIAIQAGEMAESHVRMARHLKGYYKFLEKLVQITDYTPFFVIHFQTIAVILAYHDLVTGPAKEHYLAMGAILMQKPQVMAAMAAQAEAQAAANGASFATAVP